MPAVLNAQLIGATRSAKPAVACDDEIVPLQRRIEAMGEPPHSARSTNAHVGARPEEDEDELERLAQRRLGR
jgi:hypothetical protein